MADRRHPPEITLWQTGVSRWGRKWGYNVGRLIQSEGSAQVGEDDAGFTDAQALP